MGDHRADRRAPRRSSSVTPPRSTTDAFQPHGAGKRRAPRSDASSRGRLVRGLPSMPVLAGAATIAIAALGAVTAVDSPATTVAAQQSVSFTPASALSGTSASSSSGWLDGRGQNVSRDSSRAALAESADKDLAAEAEAQAKQRNAALAQLGKKAEAQAARIARKAEARAAKIARDAWVLPLESYTKSAGFGASSYLWSALHTGQDLAAPSGTPIRSVANGIVTEVAYDGSYGNKTVVTLEDGTEIWYCHQTSFLVNAGDTVRGGETIGTVGSTGNSTGPHLHLEVRENGRPVDPDTWLRDHGIDP